MVFNQDTNRIEDVKTRESDDKGKEPLDRPTESIEPWRRPSKIEVELHHSLLPMTFYSYPNLI